MSIKDSTFQNINGGLGSLFQTVLFRKDLTFTISKSHFISINSTDGGLIAFVSAENSSVLIYNSTFKET